MSNFIRNVSVNVGETIGSKLYFKRFLSLVYNYQNGEKTDEIVGYKVLVESEKTRSNLVLKVNDVISEDSFNSLVSNEAAYYNKYVTLKDARLIAYAHKNTVKWSLQCSKVGFKNE